MFTSAEYKAVQGFAYSFMKPLENLVFELNKNLFKGTCCYIATYNRTY